MVDTVLVERSKCRNIALQRCNTKHMPLKGKLSGAVLDSFCVRT